jgi:hypothetical protein
MRRLQLVLALLCAAALAACGVGSDTICHDVNNQCPAGQVCQNGSCIPSCSVDPSVCTGATACYQPTGKCLIVCTYYCYGANQYCENGLCLTRP